MLSTKPHIKHNNVFRLKVKGWNRVSEKTISHKTFANRVSGKGPVFRIYTELFLVNKKKTKGPIKK